jgi:aminoglycoside phosphotransferase (APT) family kinase protein
MRPVTIPQTGQAAVACSLRMRGTPPAEVDIDAALVRSLLEAQSPDLADLPLHDPVTGWDNTTWRLGAGLAVRLPRREVAATLLLHEQVWLSSIADRLPLPVPAPVVAGLPTPRYPWAWSVVPWYDGDVAARTALRPDEASVLGRFLTALHLSAPVEAPSNPYRGVPLTDRLPAVEQWRSVEHRPDDAELVSGAAALVVDTAHDQPSSRTRVWLHGDLHPRNILVRDGRFAAILDWGDLCGGDPATDLATAWWLFPIEHHDAFWASYAPTYDDNPEATWHRARAWAAMVGLMFLNFATADDPDRADAEAAELGRAMLHRALGPQRPPIT